MFLFPALGYSQSLSFSEPRRNNRRVVTIPVSVVSRLRRCLDCELFQESGPNRVRRSPSLAGKGRLWHPRIHHHVRRHRQDNLALRLTNMLLKCATRRSQLASQLIRGRPFRTLRVPSLDRSKQRLHLLLSQIPKQTAQRQEESIVGHTFSGPLVQHLSLPHLVQAFEQAPDIVVLETYQAVILPSSEEYWWRHLEEIVRADY